MRSILRHLALISSINIIRVIACDAHRVLFLVDHQRLWAFNTFILCARVWCIFGALLVIGVATVHAAHAISHRTPQQVSAQIAMCRGRVGVLLKSMRMRKAFLVAVDVTSS